VSGMVKSSLIPIFEHLMFYSVAGQRLFFQFHFWHLWFCVQDEYRSPRICST